MQYSSNLYSITEKIKEKSPLIHCITSPIAINDCANLVLAVGARPIMVEHPAEVSDVTAMADALSVSLANITDARAESVIISGIKAKELGIPKVIDVVGVTCSKLRKELALRFISECGPEVIKGNISEIRAVCGLEHGNSGVDTAEKDRIQSTDDGGIRDMLLKMRDFAKKTGAVLLATGETDLITDGNVMLRCDNGAEEMSSITGTGCMISCLTAVMLSAAIPIEAAAFAVSSFGVAGELADKSKGLGSFHMHILDEISLMTKEKYGMLVKLSML